MRYIAIALVLFLSACAPQMQEYREDEKQGRLEHESYVTHDGVALPMRSWGPKNPRAVIVALHGFNDYSRAFEGAGKYFAKRGIVTYAYDQRGFGASPQTGIWADERNLTRDFDEFFLLIKKRHRGVPLYLLGESMGGAVAISTLALPDYPPVDGVILVAPAVWGGETMSSFIRTMSWLAAYTFPSKTFTGVDLKIKATDNIELLREMGRDKLIIKATRADTIWGLMTLMDSGYEKAYNIRVPTLVVYGRNDQVIPPEPVENAVAHLGSRARFVRYPDGYHMLLRDLQGEVVLKDIAEWMRDPKKELPSGFETD